MQLAQPGISNIDKVQVKEGVDNGGSMPNSSQYMETRNEIK